MRTVCLAATTRMFAAAGLLAGGVLMGCGDARLGAGSDDPERAGQIAALVADLPCADEVAAHLTVRGAIPQPLSAPPTGRGGRVVRLPTGEIGRWLVVTLEPGVGSVIVERSPDGDRTRAFDDACNGHGNDGAADRLLRSNSEPEDSAGGLPRYSDADLAAAVAEAAPSPLVVYLWSPHMPLSVDGVAEVLQAGHDAGVPVEVLLIDHADLEFARREAHRVEMPPSSLRVAHSVELLMRDAQLHAPSLLIFSAGRVSPVLPGYRNAEGYARFIEAFRAGR